MSLLALDTSSLACSVAVQIEDVVVERHEEQAREHTRLLVPMITDVLQEAGLSLHDLDAIVLGNGPGSFIGMRIAASTAQGLAFGAGIPVVPVSSMLAVAARVSAENDVGDVVVCQDAHMNEVYLGLYSIDDEGLPVTLGAERLHDLSPVPELRDATGRFTAAGFGWQRYPALHEANAPYLRATSEVLHPSARYLLPTGRALLASGAAVSPQDVIPAYVRQTVAQKPPRA